jgi:hypothetical protein
MMEEEEDDEWRQQQFIQSLSKVYPNVYVIQSYRLWKTPVVLQFAKSYKLILKN